MEITEVRIKLMDGVHDRLLGFCSITFDRAFVVRDLKIIKGSRGAFVAMPSRKLTNRCRNCGNKNPLRSSYCAQCGVPLPEHRTLKSVDGRTKLYADIAHPINSECRDQIQHSVLVAYGQELQLSQQPGYICRYDDFGENDIEGEDPERWGEEFARKEQALTPESWESTEETDPRIESEPTPSTTPTMKGENGQGDGFGDGLL